MGVLGLICTLAIIENFWSFSGLNAVIKIYKPTTPRKFHPAMLFTLSWSIVASLNFPRPACAVYQAMT
jgi:hypothetical protein